MASSCIGDIALNITQDCEKPNIYGYTGRAVYIPLKSNPTITKLQTNPRVVTEITLPENVHLMYIDNADPLVASFEGSTTETNTDSGRTLFRKTIKLLIPLRGANVSKSLVEPLLYDTNGGLMILEKKAEVFDGKYEVIGLFGGIKASGSVTRDDVTKGSWEVELSCDEVYPECTMQHGATLEENKAYFEDLIDFAFA